MSTKPASCALRLFDCLQVTGGEEFCELASLFSIIFLVFRYQLLHFPLVPAVVNVLVARNDKCFLVHHSGGLRRAIASINYKLQQPKFARESGFQSLGPVEKRDCGALSASEKLCHFPFCCSMIKMKSLLFEELSSTDGGVQSWTFTLATAMSPFLSYY